MNITSKRSSTQTGPPPHGLPVDRHRTGSEVAASSGWIRVVRRMLEVPQPMYGSWTWGPAEGLRRTKNV